MMELLSATRKLHGKSREFPQNNLLTLSLDAAFNFQFALVRSYSNDTDPIEMCQELKRFYERSMDLAREHFRFWSKDDKRYNYQALEFVKEGLFLRALLVACTTSCCGENIVLQNVGIRFKGIAVMIDDGCRDREADTYIPMTKLAHIPADTHIFGDMEQDLPAHISNMDKSFNEFVNRG